MKNTLKLGFIFFVITLIGNISFAQSQQSKPLTGMPKMVFKERMFDFGVVKKGEKREHTFEFTNEGDVDLVIGWISSCDCTTTDYSTRPVPPGGTGKIHVVFDSEKKDKSETVEIDIDLENVDPTTDIPIFERIQYKFELEK